MSTWLLAGNPYFLFVIVVVIVVIMIIFSFQGRLFEEIAEGLKQAKVMLVCVSDEVSLVFCASLRVILY